MEAVSNAGKRVANGQPRPQEPQQSSTAKMIAQPCAGTEPASETPEHSSRPMPDRKPMGIE